MNELRSLLDIPNKTLTNEEYRGWIVEAEKTICEQQETFDRDTSIAAGFNLEQATTPGLYTRVLTMTSGSLVFSKIHMKTHPFVILKGKVTVYDGDEVQLLEAPYHGVTPAGTKRVLYVHEETQWATFHPTELDDLEAIDENGAITCDSFDEYDKLMLEVAS